MRITLNIETDRCSQLPPERSVPDATKAAAMTVIEDAWRKVLAATSPDEQELRNAWVGGAILVYAMLLGLDPAAVQRELMERIPADKEPSVRSIYSEVIPSFVEQPRDPKRPKPRQWRVEEPLPAPEGPVVYGDTA